jgi:predicted metal-dependent hydrolase
MTMDKYELIRSNRKTIALQIKGDGRIIVRAPLRMAAKDIQRFVDSKAAWIEKHLAIIRQRQQPAASAFTLEQLQQLADGAKQDIPQRVVRFAALVGVTYGRITIRAQKSRWGSCSGKGNLNFNCLLMLCPDDVRDYVVVHELCHRKELNHSPRFWVEVEKVLPGYKVQRKWLKDNSSAIIRRLP